MMADTRATDAPVALMYDIHIQVCCVDTLRIAMPLLSTGLRWVTHAYPWRSMGALRLPIVSC